MENKLPVIIPAAGLGRRMKSYGPKALIDIHGKSVLQRQIDIINSTIENPDITVITGFEKKKFPKNIHTICNDRFLETNVAYSIYLGVKNLNAALIVYGDLVFNKKILENLQFSRSFVILDSTRQMRNSEVGAIACEGKICNFSYSLPTKWTQIAYIQGEELDIFKDYMRQAKYERHFCFEILNKVIDAGGEFFAQEQPDIKIAEIDSSKDIDKALLVGLGE